MWYSRLFSAEKFLTSFKHLSDDKTYKFDVVDLQLRHWCEIPSFAQLVSRCDQLAGVELAPEQLIVEMEQEVLTGQQDNIEVIDISDKQLKLQVNKLKSLKVEYVLCLDRVDEDFDKLDRKWVLDTFMPIMALHAHKDDIKTHGKYLFVCCTVEIGLFCRFCNGQNNPISTVCLFIDFILVLPNAVRTFEIFDDEETRRDYVKLKNLLHEKANYCVAETAPLDVPPSPPTHITPPDVNKTTKKQTRSDTREEEKTRREELNRKKTVMPETGKKKRKLF